VTSQNIDINLNIKNR